jgi:hypothetical protein
MNTPTGLLAIDSALHSSAISNHIRFDNPTELLPASLLLAGLVASCETAILGRAMCGKLSIASLTTVVRKSTFLCFDSRRLTHREGSAWLQCT